jgi:hypothetical protein
MRHITTLLALSTLILAITTAYLYQQLTAARDRALHEVAGANILRAQVTRLESDREELESDLRAVRHTSTAGPTVAVELSGGPRATPQVLPAAGMPRAPEMTEEQRLAVTRRRYRSLFRELALSDAEVESILPVLVAQDLRANKPLPKELASQEEPQRNQSELAAVLGAEKAQRFTALRLLQPARSQVSMLRQRLEDSGDPLTADQQQALIKILANKTAEPTPQRSGGDDPRQSMDQMAAKMRERDQRLRQDAAPVLTVAQRQSLDEDIAFQDTMRLRAAAILTPQAGSSAPSAQGP